MNTISGSNFRNTRVQLDNINYVNCSFDGCAVVYSGGGPIGLNSCNFTNCRWEFDGPAANTLKFLTLMYKVQPELIESVFESVRRGGPQEGGQSPEEFPDTINF